MIFHGVDYEETETKVAAGLRLRLEKVLSPFRVVLHRAFFRKIEMAGVRVSGTCRCLITALLIRTIGLTYAGKGVFVTLSIENAAKSRDAVPRRTTISLRAIRTHIKNTKRSRPITRRTGLVEICDDGVSLLEENVHSVKRRLTHDVIQAILKRSYENGVEEEQNNDRPGEIETD